MQLNEPEHGENQSPTEKTKNKNETKRIDLINTRKKRYKKTTSAQYTSLLDPANNHLTINGWQAFKPETEGLVITAHYQFLITSNYLCNILKPNLSGSVYGEQPKTTDHIISGQYVWHSASSIKIIDGNINYYTLYRMMKLGASGISAFRLLANPRKSKSDNY